MKLLWIFLIAAVSIALVGTVASLVILRPSNEVTQPTPTPTQEAIVYPTSTIPMQDNVWTTYTNANYINSMAFEDGKLWLGTEGGLLMIDPISETYIKYTTSTSGLTSNLIHAIAIDSKGNKWLGTNTGVLKFDGTSWTTYTTDDGLLCDNVIDIAIDGDDKIWFATYDARCTSGVSVFDGSTWTSYTTDDGLAHEWVDCIYADSGGDIWLGTFSGVSVFDGSTWTNPGVSQHVECVVEDSKGNMWFCTPGGLIVYDGVNQNKYTTSDGIGGHWISDIAIDDDNNVWVGCGYSGGLSVFNGQTWTAYTSEDGMGWDWVSCLELDDDGNIWVGHTFGGGQSSLIGKVYTGAISKFDGSTFTSYRIPGGPENNYITSVAVDDEGNNWFGTGYGDSGGTCVFDGTDWTLYTDSYLRYLNDIAVDLKGNLWFATDYWGLIVFADGAIRAKYTESNGIAGNNVRRITVDEDGRIWIAAEGGISVYDGTDWTSYFWQDGLASYNIWAVAVDRSGDVWVATNDGISQFDGSTWTTYEEGEYIYSVAVDTDDNKWFGTTDGVLTYDGKDWTRFTQEDVLAADYIRNIYTDIEGNVWICYSGGSILPGVTKFDGTTWTTYTTKDGLASNWVKDIVMDNEGNLWFATAQGISKYGWGFVSDPLTPQPLIVSP